jgi:hypothetical protein
MTEMRRTRASGGEQLGLKRRPLNASDLNKALGIDPSSPDPITERDRAYRYEGIPHCVVSMDDGKIITVSRDTAVSRVDWKTNIGNGEG